MESSKCLNLAIIVLLRTTTFQNYLANHGNAFYKMASALIISQPVFFDGLVSIH